MTAPSRFEAWLKQKQLLQRITDGIAQIASKHMGPVTVTLCAVSEEEFKKGEAFTPENTERLLTELNARSVETPISKRPWCATPGSARAAQKSRCEWVFSGMGQCIKDAMKGDPYCRRHRELKDIADEAAAQQVRREKNRSRWGHVRKQG